MQIKVFALSGFLAAAALVAWEHINVQRVRAEKTRLLSTQAEAAQFQSDLAVFETWEDVPAQILKLRAENHDLPKLRNQIRELREQQQELARLQAENARLRVLAQQASGSLPTLPAFLAGQPIVTKENLTNAGFASPQATAQTYFWSLREVNLEAWMTCLTPQLARTVGAQGTNSFFMRMLKENASVTGYIFSGTAPNAQTLGTDRLDLTVYGLIDPSTATVTAADGTVQQSRIGFRLPLTKLNGEWKVENFLPVTKLRSRTP